MVCLIYVNTLSPPACIFQVNHPIPQVHGITIEYIISSVGAIQIVSIHGVPVHTHDKVSVLIEMLNSEKNYKILKNKI